MAGASFSIRGRKVRSKHSSVSAASFAIQAICSGKRRGLIVWQTSCEPEAP
jgi:hypothetical protein